MVGTGVLQEMEQEKILPVSYTHLDVYKRQEVERAENEVKDKKWYDFSIDFSAIGDILALLLWKF